ncbi:hypothetical protein [Runella aurantiaca]|uniref:Uncharacterized protein n=1 Tax=Runella aurantiaca TaxID=2282308 RepID=A0A369I014_9BACT|nr:hypothetical protein [Runella aurantiaca]RDB03121.1 hypothetical protein DVG78_25515 [Runella aurantiaca]
MKTIRLVCLLALVGSMFVACQKEVLDASAPSTTPSHSALREEGDCDCVEEYSDEDKVIYEYDRGVKVDVWNDATTVYFKVYRLDPDANNDDQIGNLEVDGVKEGGDNQNVYEFTKPIGTLQACDKLLTDLTVIGAGGPPIVIEDLSYSIVTLCPPPPVCTYTYDTGFGGTDKGAGKAWWYYYPAGSGVKTIYAGQTKVAGTVTIDAAGNYTISLAPGWSLKDGTTESVKIQGYITLPASRPAAGLFSGPSSYKGTSLTGSIAPQAFYVIHLDLQYCTLQAP